VAAIVFWSIFILFSRRRRRPRHSGTGRVTDYVFSWVPKLIGAALILLVGWLVANFRRRGALIAAVNARIREARLVARAIRWRSCSSRSPRR
jgi:hypothetical protein